MRFSCDDYNYLIRLDKGERLSEALDKFITDTKIEGGWLSGVGGALEVTLGFYDLDKKQYHWQQFEGLREILSLSGNLAFDEEGKLVIHLHGVFGDDKFQTIGGHVKDLVAAATVELFVHRIDRPAKRALDPSVGLKTLDL